MNGYSKINVTGSGNSSHKSRSIDFSDMFSSFPQTPSQSKNSSTDDESGTGEQFGVILGRSTSVVSSSSSSAPGMKRTFSVRRSSSVSERYCRIHDQYINMAINGDDTTDIDHHVTVNKKKKHRGGKILKACKRLLRF